MRRVEQRSDKIDEHRKAVRAQIWDVGKKETQIHKSIARALIIVSRQFLRMTEPVEFDRNGHLLRISSSLEAQEAHGMTLVLEDAVELLWIADAGQRRTTANQYKPPLEDGKSVVLKLSLDGRTLQRLPRPTHPAYEDGYYRPTSVAVSETRFGGNGDVWVADGYGESYVHRFAASGTRGSRIPRLTLVSSRRLPVEASPR